MKLSIKLATIDALAAVETEGEEREAEDLCDEPGQDDEASLRNAADGPKHMADLEHDTADEEPDHDNEPSAC